MSDSDSADDAYAGMRAAYNDAVETWAQAVEQVVSGEDFAATAGQLLKRYADFQMVVRDQARATADSLHMPTKDDLAQLATLIINLERKVDSLAARTDDGLMERLGALEVKLDALAGAIAEAQPAKKTAPKRRPRTAKKSGGPPKTTPKRTDAGA